MVQRIVVLLAMVLLGAMLVGCAATGQDSGGLDHDIDGVRVSFRTADWGVRDAWIEGPRVYRAEEVPPDDRAFALAAVTKAIRHVPPMAGFLRESNSRIVLVNRLELEGVRVGGFCGGRGICIAIRGRSQIEIARTFYHEAAHVLMRRYVDRFPTDRWHQLNPDGFKYINDDAIEAIKNRDSTLVLRTELAHAGFVSRYAQTNIREDFAETSEVLLTQPHLLNVGSRSNRVMEIFPALREKLRLAQEVWESALPEMATYIREARPFPDPPSDRQPESGDDGANAPLLIARSKAMFVR